MSIDIQIRLENEHGYSLWTEYVSLDQKTFHLYQNWEQWTTFVLDRFEQNKNEYTIVGPSLDSFSYVKPDSIIQIDYRLSLRK